MASGARWSRDDTIAALSLYVQTPFGRMHAGNRDIIALADRLGRTPSSLAMKLCNFASLDPVERARGISGMSNVSRLDREIWAEYAERWSDLARAGADLPLDDTAPPATERITEATQRIGQAFFRRAVLAAWDNACCITGLSVPALLRASHIVPWATDEANRLNPRNGLCLNALHDAAFDRGLMTIDESLRVVYARDLRSALKKSAASAFMVEFDGVPLRAPDRFRPDDAFLNHHRSSVFVGA